jgi:predicted AAA+ superfamily ATPase
MYTRLINPTKSKSFFLFGPRQTGKSTFVRSLIESKDLYIDLLPQRTYLHYAKHPGLLREEILAHAQKNVRFRCIIDEIQKIPELLDEVHEMIENKGIQFVMTGSSARKLRRGGVNLLAGRAYTYRLFPLTFFELGTSFNLEQALIKGCLPPLWNDPNEDYREFLRAYAETYLKEEVAAEGLVRNIGPFAYFFDIAAANDGEMVNFTNIARECNVTAKTVQQYYQILEDTFIAIKVSGWHKSPRKKMITQPRYYFFDTGITNVLSHTLMGQLNPIVRGRRFEQFMIYQIYAIIHYKRLDYQLYYWRTNNGAEVDLLICQGHDIKYALEIKSSKTIVKEKLRGLKQFIAAHPDVSAYVVGIDQKKRLIDGHISLMNWQDFLEMLQE